MNLGLLKQDKSAKAEQKRDANGKFAAKKAGILDGAGGLSPLKKLNIKRVLPMIIIVALVGGTLVWRSFAAVSPEQGKAQVTTWYWICLNRAPDPGGLNYWAGRLSTENANAVFQAFWEKANKPACNYPDRSNTGTGGGGGGGGDRGTASSITREQVIDLYKTILNKSPSESDISYWIEKGKTWTYAQIKATIEASPEAFRKNVAKYVTDAQAWKTLADAYVVNAKNDNDKTYKISKQTVVSKADLDTIAQIDGKTRSVISQLSSATGQINTSYTRATAISELSPQAAQIKAALDSVNASIKSINNYLINISNDYKRAEKTYEDNLNFFNQVADRKRQEEQCRARGGTPTWNGGCNIPHSPAATQRNDCAGVRANSSKSSIKACQRYLGVTADGIWGPKTEAAFVARFGYASGYQPSGGSGGGAGSGDGSNACPPGYYRKDGECRPAPTTPPQAQPYYRCPIDYFWDSSLNKCFSNAATRPTCPAGPQDLASNDNNCGYSNTPIRSECPFGKTKRQNTSDGRWRCRYTANKVLR